MADDMQVVIVGCGRLGSLLANRLSRSGHSLVVIDRNYRTFDELSPDFSGFRIEGDATQMVVLREARLEQADAVVATTHDDNVNVMVAQLALEVFGVNQVLARVFDPKREEVYASLGIETVCPTSVAAEMFLKVVSDRGRS